jgi:hypothetical protein
VQPVALAAALQSVDIVVQELSVALRVLEPPTGEPSPTTRDAVTGDIVHELLDAMVETPSATSWALASSAAVATWLRSRAGDAVRVRLEALVGLRDELPTAAFAPCAPLSVGLLPLPAQYDTLAGKLCNVKCRSCKQHPESPALCLVCGAFLCGGMS